MVIFSFAGDPMQPGEMTLATSNQHWSLGLMKSMAHLSIPSDATLRLKEG